MEQTLTREAVLRRDKRIIFICWLAYAMAYVGRLNFSASIVAIISDLGVTKAQAPTAQVSSSTAFSQSIITQS